MTRTISDRIRGAIPALFAQSRSGASTARDPADILRDDTEEDDRRRAYERDEDFHRLWAMHGHW